MSDSDKELDLIDESQYRDTNEMEHEYKLKKLREKKQALVLRKRKRDELRAAKQEIRGVKREAMRERVQPLQRLTKQVGGGMARAGQGFARSMAKKQPQRGSSGSQPRGMFDSGGGGLLSMGGGSSKFDMSMGRGKKSPFTFSKRSNVGSGLSMSILGSHSTGRKKKRRSR